MEGIESEHGYYMLQSYFLFPCPVPLPRWAVAKPVPPARPYAAPHVRSHVCVSVCVRVCVRCCVVKLCPSPSPNK